MLKRFKPNFQLDKTTLFHVPIIHTQADMGALSESIKHASRMKHGVSALNRKNRIKDKIWTEIERTVDGLGFSYGRTRLYQDGLPVCGREADIVTDLARSGSRNHSLLLRMMGKGATIMGTESADLLVEEYELFKSMLYPGKKPGLKKSDPNLKQLSESILKRRDRFIADHINHTLLEGETGILFLGMLHDVEHLIDRNIHVVYPVNRSFIKG